MLEIEVSNMIHIPMSDPSYSDHLDRIKERFCYPNPVYEDAAKKGFKKIEADPLVQNWNYSFINNEKCLAIPRGQMSWLRDYLKKNNIPYSFSDKRSPGHDIEVEWNPENTPFPYQETGVEIFQKYHQGFFCYDPGAGKTALALLAISKIKKTTLILLNSNELLKQWRLRIKKFLKYDSPIGLIQQSNIDIQPITLASIGTLIRWSTEELEKLNNYFGILIHDEAHHSPSEGNQKVLSPLSQKYRMALTASKTRKDRLEFLGYDYYDKIRQVEKGNVLVPTVIQINTGVDFPWNKYMRWQNVEKKLSENNSRNHLIVSNIIEDVRAGHKVLTLFTRKTHARKITRILQDNNIRAICLVHGVEFDVDVLAQKMEAGEIQVIVGCKIFDEGIDIPVLSSAHLCSPSSNYENLRQRTGRVNRPHKSKLPPVIRDYKDELIPCKVSAKKRLEWYREFGYNVSYNWMARNMTTSLFELFGWSR